MATGEPVFDRDRDAVRQHRRFIGASAIGLGVMALAFARLSFAAWPDIGAPNLVPINASLITSGQPSLTALSDLAAQGVEAVIYLGPRTGPDWVPEEPALLSKQRIEFVPIAFPPDGPSAAHYQLVADALKRLTGRRVLVHCQINMQASVFVFLNRVIAGNESPEKAYAAVAKVWSPQGAWKELIVTMLRKHGQDFDPY